MQQQGTGSESPPGYLRIINATWGSPDRPGSQVDVTGAVSRWVEEKGFSRFFYMSPKEAKEDLLGDPQKGMEKDLTIEYQFAQFPSTTETFHQNQEVLVGDVEGYYQSISDVYGSIPDDVADQLLYRYRPVLNLHPQETSYPCRAEWYLPKVALYFQYKNTQTRLVESVDNPEMQLYQSHPHLRYTFHSREQKRFFLKHNDSQHPDLRNGERDNVNNCPFYGSVAVTQDGDICLTYFFLYAFNGPIMESILVPGPIRNMAGIHQGDWEYLSIRVSPDGEQIRAILMSRHRWVDSQWYLAPTPQDGADMGWHVDPSRGNRIRVLPGKESHANYNVPGMQSRGHGGFVDDRCGFGVVWDPVAVVNMGTPARPRVPWLRYGGIWGKPKENKIEGEGPEGPILKTAFFGKHPEMSAQNTLPVYGDWWRNAKMAYDAQVTASGRSLIRPRKPLARGVPGVGVAVRNLDAMGFVFTRPAAVGGVVNSTRELGGFVTPNQVPASVAGAGVVNSTRELQRQMQQQQQQQPPQGRDFNMTAVPVVLPPPQTQYSATPPQQMYAPPPQQPQFGAQPSYAVAAPQGYAVVQSTQQSAPSISPRHSSYVPSAVAPPPAAASTATVNSTAELQRQQPGYNNVNHQFPFSTSPSKVPITHHFSSPPTSQAPPYGGYPPSQ